MKYKVGDKFRMVDGGIASVEGARCDIYKVIDDGGVNYVTNAYISHQIISEITDELIDRFKKEKIAWHFKNKEDYEKTLDILYSKGVVYKSKRWLFNFNCIQYYSEQESLYRENLEYYRKEEFEIIEIINPVYVPKFDLPCEHFETTHVWVETSDGKRLTKPMYKGYDCEKMFQQYMQQKKIPDLENKVENQQKEIVRLNQRNEQYQEQMKILLDDVNFYKGRISVVRDILDYED